MASASSSVTHCGSGSKARSFAVRLVRSTGILLGGFRSPRNPLTHVMGASVLILLKTRAPGDTTVVSGVRVDNERKSAIGGSSADEGVRPTMARSCEGKGYYAAGLYATASISTLMPG